jgi:O-Antigen ligase
MVFQAIPQFSRTWLAVGSWRGLLSGAYSVYLMCIVMAILLHRSQWLSTLSMLGACYAGGMMAVQMLWRSRLSHLSRIVLLSVLLGLTVLHWGYAALYVVHGAVLAAYMMRLVTERNYTQVSQAALIVALPGVLIGLNAWAYGGSDAEKHVWNAIDGSAIALGLWLHAQVDKERLTNIVVRVLPVVLLVSIVYMLRLALRQDLRGSNIYLFGFLVADSESFKSPHTSMYGACCVVLAVFVWHNTHYKWARLLMPGVVLAGLYYVAVEAWRPVWLGLVCAFAAVAIVNIRSGRQKISKIFWAFLLVQGVLLATDFASYRTGWTNLIKYAAQEERMQIWTRTWTAIAQGPTRELWIGHGFGTFRSACQDGVCLGANGPTLVEHSPHNIFLDTLFSSGVLGLTASLVWFAIVFRFFIQTAGRAVHFGAVDAALAIMVILTCVSGLNFPLLDHKYVFPMALMCSLTWYSTAASGTPTATTTFAT